MWDGLFSLVTYGIVMALASFLAGSLPLSFSLPQNHSRIISAIGTGLLVGTCLIIIIPEGVETLYSSTFSSATHAIASPNVGDNDRARRAALRYPYTRRADGNSAASTDGDEYHDPHAWIGISLITGFIMMYLIDQLPRHAAKYSKPNKPLHISLANLSQGPHRASSPRQSDEGDTLEDGQEPPLLNFTGSATTIGLVIHAVADGVALAASSFISKVSTGFIVFLALMLHKAPAAFGLTSVLLKQGHTKRQARAHLIVFSLAAPVGAIATWIIVNLVAGDHIEGQENTAFATGLLLLFSGGTFLYVAVHTMQETTAELPEEGGNGYANGHSYSPVRSAKGKEKHTEIRDTMLVVVGMVLPLLAQVGHAH